MQQKLVLATRNKGKLVEFRRILEALAPGEINLVGVDEFPDLVDVEETGTTFEENALLKARYTAEATGLPAISDDSGLCVDFLNGDPGIYSARWAGSHGNDQANLEKLLNELKDVSQDKRTAHFTYIPLEAIVTTDFLIDEVVKSIKFENPILVVAPNSECVKKTRKFQVGLKKRLGVDVRLAAFFHTETGSGPTDVERLELLVGNGKASHMS